MTIYHRACLNIGRRGVLKIGVVLTDGRAQFEKATEAEAKLVKDSGIFLIAIGVGRLIKVSMSMQVLINIISGNRLTNHIIVTFP